MDCLPMKFFEQSRKEPEAAETNFSNSAFSNVLAAFHINLVDLISPRRESAIYLFLCH